MNILLQCLLVTAQQKCGGHILLIKCLFVYVLSSSLYLGTQSTVLELLPVLWILKYQYIQIFNVLILGRWDIIILSYFVHQPSRRLIENCNFLALPLWFICRVCMPALLAVSKEVFIVQCRKVVSRRIMMTTLTYPF